MFWPYFLDIRRYKANPIPSQSYLFKFNNRNNRKRCEIYSKLRIKTPERRHWRLFGVFIVDVTYFTPFSSVPIVDFEQVNVHWAVRNEFLLPQKSKILALLMDWNYRTNSILRNQYFVSEHQDKENLHNLINLKRERSNRIEKMPRFKKNVNPS